MRGSWCVKIYLNECFSENLLFHALLCLCFSFILFPLMSLPPFCAFPCLHLLFFESFCSKLTVHPLPTLAEYHSFSCTGLFSVRCLAADQTFNSCLLQKLVCLPVTDFFLRFFALVSAGHRGARGTHTARNIPLALRFAVFADLRVFTRTRVVF